MSQFKRIFCCGFLVSILGLLTGAPFAAAEPQAGKANWDNLKQLVPGQEIKVVLNDAKAFQGKFESLNEQAVVLRLATGQQSFARGTVLRISMKRQARRGRNTLRGVFVGAPVGLALGAVVDANAKCLKNGQEVRCSSNYGKGFFAGNGAFWGAVIGALLPTGGWHDIYRAR